MARIARVVIPIYHITSLSAGSVVSRYFSAIRIAAIIKSPPIYSVYHIVMAGRAIFDRAVSHRFLWTIIIIIQRPGALT
jgi:hypothetical protein